MENIVEQIHKEFETAHMKHLLPCVQTSVEELYQLGFTKSANAEEYEYGHEYLRETAQQYITRYPNNRFISEKQVERICKKYGLLCAPVEHFIGEIPSSKVAAIISFEVMKGDVETRQIETYGSGDTEFYISRNPYLDSQNKRGRLWGGSSKDERTVENPQDKIKGFGLWICATENELNTKGLVKTGHNVGIAVVRDPVVLQPVNGGFLIVAAWGDEASDEDVVNNKMN